MPANTPRGYPYPVDADTINVPRDVQALAAKLDTDLTAWRVNIASLYGWLSYAGKGQYTTNATGQVTVTFPAAFTTPPDGVVVQNYNADPSFLTHHVVNDTTTGGFTFHSFRHNDNTPILNEAVFVRWYAYGPQPVPFPP